MLKRWKVFIFVIMLLQNISAGSCLYGPFTCVFNNMFLRDFSASSVVSSLEDTEQSSLTGVSLATGLKVEQETMINSNFVPSPCSYQLDGCVW